MKVVFFLIGGEAGDMAFALFLIFHWPEKLTQADDTVLD